MLREALGTAPAESIEDVIEIMGRINLALPDNDGIKWFNHLYLRVTEGVQSAIGRAGGSFFKNAQFMTALDVTFGNLYFAALRHAEDIDMAPAAWRHFLRVRGDRRIARLQFALAGMNAHINRDLPAGIVQVFEKVGGDPLTGRRQHEDFERVNDILVSVEAQVKNEFSVGIVGVADRLGGRIDDVLAMWSVKQARETAWTNAAVLWALRPTPNLKTGFFERLDSLTGFAGRGLLAPGIL